MMRLLAVILLAGLTLPAQTLIEPRIESETLPAGGLMQIKLGLTSPHPITTSGADFQMDLGFDGVEGVALMSPSGDAYGVAVVQGQSFRSDLVSPLASLGTQLDYPFLVIATKIRAGLAAGTRVPINFGGTTFFTGPGGTPYAMPAAKSGVLTIGGSLSVFNVIPGGGQLPAGSTVRLLGTGFTAQTRVDVGEANTSNLRYVSPTEVQFTVNSPIDITGRRIRVRNPGGEEVVYYSYLRAVPVGASTRALLNACHPLFPNQQVTSAGLTLPTAPANGFVALALRNMALVPVEVQLELLSAAGGSLGRASVSMPAGSQFLRTTQELFGTATGGALVRLTSSGAVQVLGLRGDDASRVVTAFVAGEAPVVTPQLVASPASLAFDGVAGGAAPPAKSVSLTSTGEPLAYTATSSAAWLTVSPTSGQTPATLTVTANPSGLAAGQYQGTVRVGSQSIPVTLNVAAVAELVFSPASLAFDGAGSKSLSVSSTGAPMPFQASTSVAWLTVSPVSGQTPATLTVTANPSGLAAGQYQGTVRVGSQTISVTLTVAATAELVFSPASLAFDGAGSKSLGVSSTGAPMPFQASTSVAWLTVSPVSGQTPATLTVTANPGGLATGPYQGTVRVGSQSIPVTLNVAAGPPILPLRLTPTSLQFSYSTGGAVPGAQAVQVEGDTAGPLFTVSTSSNWLTARASRASTPATLSVAVLPEGLAQGNYSGSVAVTTSAGATQFLTVTLIVASGPSRAPDVTSIVNAASQSAGAVAPGEIVTLYGGLLGPATGQGAVLAGANRVDTINAGTRVWFGSTPAPILYTSMGQVNAMVPYEASGLTRVEVEYRGERSAAREVLVVPAAPAIFTQNASGRGPAAVLNQDYSLNTPQRRAAAGSVIMIYATGGGQTTPQSFTGEIAGSELRRKEGPVTVTIGTRRVEALYAGAAPGLVTGALQVNVLIPADIAPGDAVPILINVEGVTSLSGPTIAIE